MEIKLAHQLWMAGDRDEARRVLKQSRMTAEEIGLPEVTAAVEYGTATFARMEGNLDEARRSAERAAEFSSHPTFAAQFRAVARSAQGLIDAASGDLAAARRWHTDALAIAVESRDAPVIAQVLVGAADLAVREGDPDRAAYLLGAADAVRGSRDRSVPDTERLTAETRAALGDEGFEAAYCRAAGVTAAEAARYATAEGFAGG
jgi:ATP/maltotriose-dependent transcriptional regulator MalT